ncbi:MAG TPA: sigma-70 family RNA polymerase sigma factor, partial [Kofleriaceae bacterium]
AWQGIGRLENPQSFAPWLRQVTRNQARMAARGRARRRRRLAEDEQLLASVADPAPGAREQLVSDEERETLAAVLDDLPDDAREIVTLYYREGRSTRQVAVLLGLGEDAVKKRLERARAAIRRDVLERFGETMKRTAPGATFTAAVAAALAIGAPGTAAAATLGTGAAVKSGGAKLLAGLGGSALGLAGGLLGAFLKFRSGSRRARDDQERRELRRVSMASGVVIALLVVGIQASAALGSAVLLVAVWLLAVAGVSTLYLGRVPRIVARRHAAELAEDPEAWRRHRRERRGTWLGLAVGVGGGTAAVVWSAWRLWTGG